MVFYVSYNFGGIIKQLFCVCITFYTAIKQLFCVCITFYTAIKQLFCLCITFYTTIKQIPRSFFIFEKVIHQTFPSLRTFVKYFACLCGSLQSFLNAENAKESAGVRKGCCTNQSKILLLKSKIPVTHIAHLKLKYSTSFLQFQFCLLNCVAIFFFIYVFRRNNCKRRDRILFIKSN